MRINLISNKNIVIIHLLFWLGYLSLSVFVFAGREDFDRALTISLVQIIPQMVIAYVNMEFLIPRFFIKKRYWTYVGLVLLSFIFLYLFYEFVLPELIERLVPHEGERRWMRGNPEGRNRQFFNPFRRMRIIYSFTQTVAIFFLSTAFKTSQIALKREKEAADLKSENLNSELKFLRSQINPHFLFNALNNIYALSIVKSDKTPENILKLSDMLRYIIYDCNEDRVPLEKELAYINNYIALQKLKDDSISNIRVNFEKVDGRCLIAPMIFIPFIENSFKHSNIEDITHGWIDIRIENTNHHLSFLIRNSVAREDYTKDKVGGIGLENVKRRLELLYPGKHELQIDSSKKEFSIRLEITLDDS